jgi:hypothetical protein
MPTIENDPATRGYSLISQAHAHMRDAREALVKVEMHQLRASIAASQGNNLLLEAKLNPVNFEGGLKLSDEVTDVRGVNVSLVRQLERLRGQMTKIDGVNRPRLLTAKEAAELDHEEDQGDF